MEFDARPDEGIEHGIDEKESEARQREADLKLLDYDEYVLSTASCLILLTYASDDAAVLELNEEDAFLRSVLKYQKLWAFVEDCCDRLEVIKMNLLRVSNEIHCQSRVQLATTSQGQSSANSDYQAAALPSKDPKASVDQLVATTDDVKLRKWMDYLTAAFYIQYYHTANGLLLEPLHEAWDNFFWFIHSNFDRLAKYDGSIRQEIDAAKKADRFEAERSKVKNNHGILVTALGELQSDLDSFLRSHRALRHQNTKKIQYAQAFKDEHEWRKLSSKEQNGLMH